MTIVQNMIVDTFGAFVGKHSERLTVTQEGKTVTQVPLLYLETLTIASRGVSLSADAIFECTERGIPIHFINSRGVPYASLYSSGLTGTVATRRAQLQAYQTYLGLRLAIAISLAKVQNQSNLLKYIAKYRKEIQADLYQELRIRAGEVLDQILQIEGMLRYPEVQDGTACIDDLRAELMGYEGMAAQRYWGAVKMTIPGQYGFIGREGRGAKDPINSALNYGYGILYSQVERCLVLAGLDPYAGFLHVDRPGKPSLTLDFIEEFRQPVVDRTVIAMANKGMVFEQDERNLLTKETRRCLTEKIFEHLDATAQYEGKRQSLRSIMQTQARHLATFLRAERPVYEGFTMSW